MTYEDFINLELKEPYGYPEFGYDEVRSKLPMIITHNFNDLYQYANYNEKKVLDLYKDKAEGFHFNFETDDKSAIFIKASKDRRFMLDVLIHEVGHALIHGKNLDYRRYNASKALYVQQEVEAELFRLRVFQHWGFSRLEEIKKYLQEDE